MKHSPYELKKSSSEKIQATQITIKVRGIARGKGKALKKEWNAKNTKKKKQNSNNKYFEIYFFRMEKCVLYSKTWFGKT